MNNYNSSEKYAAEILSKFPKVKRALKNVYATINFYIHKKKYSFYSQLEIEPVISDKNNESLFGYYDKPPVNSSGKFIIYHESKGLITHRLSNIDELVRIILYVIKKCKCEVIIETSSYNWQQGARLMWISERKFIFNDSESGKFLSRIYNTDTYSLETIIMPIYDCFKDEFALSVNFLRLKATDSDYGYGKALPYKQLPGTDIDGIFFVDLKQNTSKLIVSFENVFGLYEKLPENARHCFNHIMISPDGKHFIFIHRWYISGKRCEALLISDFYGNVRLLSDKGFVSHCCWNGNDEIIGYLEHHSHGRSFYTIDISSGRTELLSHKLLEFGDGHPSVFGNKMLFDSYPDRSRMQHLYIYDMTKDEVEEIGSFLSPMKFFGSNRCDLHPRWSPDGKSVYFDSVHEGSRHLYKMDLYD